MIELQVNLTPGVSGVLFTLDTKFSWTVKLPPTALNQVLVALNESAQPYQPKEVYRDRLLKSMIESAGKPPEGCIDRLKNIIELLMGNPMELPETVILHTFKWTQYPDKGDHADITVEFP